MRGEGGASVAKCAPRLLLHTAVEDYSEDEKKRCGACDPHGLYVDVAQSISGFVHLEKLADRSGCFKAHGSRVLGIVTHVEIRLTGVAASRHPWSLAIDDALMERHSGAS